MLHVRLFGTTRVQTRDQVLGPADFGGVKPRRILEALAVYRGHQVSKDRLTDVLWADQPPPNHIATLETYVSLLRRRLQPGTPARHSVITTVPGGYLLDQAQVSTDLDVFDTLVDQADGAGDVAAVQLLDRASALASADLLAAAGDTPWAEPVRVDYRHRALRAALRAAELALSGAAEDIPDGPDTAVRLSRRALTLDQLCEAGWRLLMRAHAAAGRRDAALRAYRSCRRLLADDLGVDPDPETQAVLVDLVRRQRALHGSHEPRGWRGGRPDWRGADLGTVLDAALVLFERGRSGEPVGPADDEVRIMTGLLHRAGVRLSGPTTRAVS